MTTTVFVVTGLRWALPVVGENSVHDGNEPPTASAVSVDTKYPAGTPALVAFRATLRTDLAVAPPPRSPRSPMTP